MNAKRIIIIGLFAILLVFVLVGLCIFADIKDNDGPPSLISKISNFALIVVAWPIFALVSILPGGYFSDTMAYLIMFLMLIPTGLFWGILIDFIYSRIKPNKQTPDRL